MPLRRRSFNVFNSTARPIAATLVVLGGMLDVISVLGNRALAFKDEGCTTASLSAASLAQIDNQRSRTGTIERGLTIAAERLESFYHVASLNEFKSKFQSRWEPIDLAQPGTANLPRIGFALLRAYFPTLSATDVRQLLTGSGAGGVSSKQNTADNMPAPAISAAAIASTGDSLLAHPVLSQPRVEIALAPLSVQETQRGDTA
jgi:hypothetical protein